MSQPGVDINMSANTYNALSSPSSRNCLASELFLGKTSSSLATCWSLAKGAPNHWENASPIHRKLRHHTLVLCSAKLISHKSAVVLFQDSGNGVGAPPLIAAQKRVLATRSTLVRKFV